MLAAQRHLAALITPDTADDAVNARLDDLADLVTVAAANGLDLDSLHTTGLADVSGLAAALHSAETILADHTNSSLAPLAVADIRDRPHPLPTRWLAASPRLTARILAIRDPKLRPVDRLRWRTTVAGKAPDGHDELPAAAIPTALWAEWAVRMQPAAGVEFGSFRVVAAAALALPGSQRKLQDLAAGRAADAPAFGRKVSHVLQIVAASDHGSHILRVLTQLSDRLRVDGSPIDYERRRRLAADTPLIDAPTWDRICAAAAVPTGGDRKLRHARLWLWELLTGGLPLQSPDSIRPSSIGHADYHTFTLGLPAAATTLLEAHARRILDSHHCGDEPTTWSPPAAWVDTERLPIGDPLQLDIARVTALLRNRRSPSEIAAELATTVDRVRLVVRQSPDLVTPNVKPRQHGAPRRTVRTVPPAGLTTERLRQLVVDERRALGSLADEFGVGRHYLTDRLRREHIPVPPPHRRPVHVVDPQWLRAEYLERKRTLPDIAAEVGTTAPNVARIARRHGIPLRGRGGASHAANLTIPDGWPQPLATAVLGRVGTERVRRFQVYARFRSLNQASTILRTRQGVLVSQLAQLEARCGGQLLVRSTRHHHPQHLTDLGRRLLAQADEHLGAHPDAPPDLPEPLARVLSAFWGHTRLEMFAVAANCDSLAAAAIELGADRHTLNRSIRSLEHVLGGVLLHRTTPAQPHRVSDLGRRLLSQASDWVGT